MSEDSLCNKSLHYYDDVIPQSNADNLFTAT